MTTKNKSEQDYSDKISSLLNPCSDNFNFELWSTKVRQQMLDVLEKRLVSSKTKLKQ